MNTRWFAVSAYLAGFALLILFALPGALPPAIKAAPSLQTSQSTSGILAGGVGTLSYIPPPIETSQIGAQSAVFNINYSGTWSPTAKNAFQYAVNIWTMQITSQVPIEIAAEWISPGGNPPILAFGEPYNFQRDFSGAPMANTWYPVALANKLSGTDLDPANPDINVRFSDGVSWYFGTDGNTPSGRYDFVTAALHAIGLSLGFNRSLEVAGGQGSWGMDGYPKIYDRFVINGSGQSVLNTSLFPNPSSTLAAQLISNNIFFDGINARAANNGNPPKLYAPNPWTMGNINHLDENTYPRGTENALFTYVQNTGEAIHNPGPIALGILSDLGWANNYSVSGRVTDVNDKGISGVIVTAVGLVNKSTITDSNGDYILNGLAAGVYTITPTKSGCAFSPRIASVPPSKMDWNLTGIADVSPFTGLNICQLQKGDILFKDGGVDPREGGFLASYWYHTGIYDGEENILEANEDDGIVRKPIQQTGFYKGAFDWAVLRLKPEYQAKIDDAIEWAIAKANDPNVTYMSPKKWINPLNKSQDKEFYCSLFVWRAFKEESIELDFEQGAIPGIDQAFPDDLYLSSLLPPQPTTVVLAKNYNPSQSLYTLHSPANLTVIDKFGNITGIDPATGTIVKNIPGSFYSGPDIESEWITVPDIGGRATVEIHGTGVGNYSFGVQVLNNIGIDTKVFHWNTHPGQVDIFEVSDPDAGELQIQPIQLQGTPNLFFPIIIKKK